MQLVVRRHGMPGTILGIPHRRLRRVHTIGGTKSAALNEMIHDTRARTQLLLVVLEAGEVAK